MSLEDYVFCGKYKDKDCCGNLYYNIKDLCFYKERCYTYLEKLDREKNYILNALSGYHEYFVYGKKIK